MSRRIAEVREVWRLYDRAIQELSTRAEGTHWRQQRLFRLWGRLLEDAEQGSRIARETLDTLEQLRRELLGLRDSRIYDAIPVRTQVPGTLRRTNILLNDPHYRKVARLWRRRERTAQDRNLSPTERFERQREFHVAFEAFGVLLTCRALKDFGFVPRDAEVPRRGRPPLRLSADNGRILGFEWQQGGDWVLREPGNNTWLRFVSMPGLSRDSRQPGSHCAPDRPGRPPGSGKCFFHPKVHAASLEQTRRLGSSGRRAARPALPGAGGGRAHQPSAAAPTQPARLRAQAERTGCVRPPSHFRRGSRQRGTRGTSASVVAHGLTAATLRSGHEPCSPPCRNTRRGTWNARATESCAWYDLRDRRSGRGGSSFKGYHCPR